MRQDRSAKISQSWRHSPFGGSAAVVSWNERSDAVYTASCSAHDVAGSTTSASAVVCVMKMSWLMRRSRFSSVRRICAVSGSVCSGSSPKL